MQPRRSPPRVRRVTNAPAGWRSASSYSAASGGSKQPSNAHSIDVRARERSCLRCASPSIDEHQVADVDDQSRRLPDDEHRVAAVNCVRGGDGAADEREVPELDRNVALPPALRGDPLHDEARGEDELPAEADEDPEVPGARIEAHGSACSLSRCAGRGTSGTTAAKVPTELTQISSRIL